MYVAIVVFGCFKSRSGDVAYVAIVSEVCCKSMFRVFQRYVSALFFRMHVAIVFICMLHMFPTYVACVLLGCFRCVFQVFQKHISSVSTVFRRILQLLYLDVSKVDLILYLSSPTFCCIVSECPPPNAGRTSIRCRRPGPFKSEAQRALPLLSLGRR